MNDKELSVYIHFMYCKSRCPYCDFFRALKPRDFDENEYVKTIISDLERLRSLTGKRRVKSVFFGGGTPSILSENAVGEILDNIDKCYDIKKGAEISLEANPNTYDRDKFKGFNIAGVNRLSLGVQALDDKRLKALGRTHNLNEAREAIKTAVELFDKSSIDLIYALKDQEFCDWVKEIDEALSFGVKHISLYQLTIEEGTVFYKKNIKGMDEDLSAKFYEDTVCYLASKGFDRYEVSNFAKDEYNRSVHNMVYWQGGDYLGLGMGAHGRLNLEGKNFSLVDGKICEQLTSDERAMELVIMGLRIKEGINVKKFYEISKIGLFDYLDMNKVMMFRDEGLLCFDEYSLRLTNKGFLVMDKIIEQIIY